MPDASAPLVAGVDSSTQSTKVLVVDAVTGQVVREGRAPHPDGSEVAPAAWWEALRVATGGLDEGLLEGVAAIGVAGQQHGMVLLDDDLEVVRPALLWNDTRSAPDARDLVGELGAGAAGAAAWADAVGSVPVASFTVTKLRWVARAEPAQMARARAVALPHDWVSWQLLGGPATGGLPATDRGDASGTGYWSPATGAYRPDLLRLAAGRDLEVPRVLGPAEAAGRTPWGALVAAGTGDNMGAALGLGMGPGDVAISLGTSGTAFAVADVPAADPSAAVAGFADATGRYLPLVCTLNAARVLDSAAALLGVDHAGLARLALGAEPGAGGLVLLPYLDGERTPDLPDARGSLHGLTRDNLTPANLARAAVEGMLCGLADGVQALAAQGVRPGRALLVGGAARNPAVQQVAAQLLGVPVAVPTPGEYVALGAARQAAWALTGQLPDWEVGVESATEVPDAQAEAGSRVLEQYAAARLALHGV
ncbi:MAG TPA: xylulokinase [Motilibacteraceae bacterium]|nr:xylulokinase [Motilibacteraceae bacterium]